MPEQSPSTIHHVTTPHLKKKKKKKLSTAYQILLVQTWCWHLESSVLTTTTSYLPSLLSLTFLQYCTEDTYKLLAAHVESPTSVKDPVETFLGSENSLGSLSKHHFWHSDSCSVLPPSILSPPAAQRFSEAGTWLLSWLWSTFSL